MLKYPKYAPSKTILKMAEEGKLNPCPGLADLVRDIGQRGFLTLVDYGDDDGCIETVDHTNVVMAVHEASCCNVVFKGTKSSGCQGKKHALFVIPENGEDWLSDYTASPWLEFMVNRFIYGEDKVEKLWEKAEAEERARVKKQIELVRDLVRTKVDITGAHILSKEGRGFQTQTSPRKLVPFSEAVALYQEMVNHAKEATEYANKLLDAIADPERRVVEGSDESDQV